MYTCLCIYRVIRKEHQILYCHKPNVFLKKNTPFSSEDILNI